MKRAKLTISTIFVLLIYCSSIFSNIAIGELLSKRNNDNVSFLEQNINIVYTPVQKTNSINPDYLQKSIAQDFKTKSIISKNLFYNKINTGNKMFRYTINKKTIFKDFFIAILFHNFH